MSGQAARDLELVTVDAHSLSQMQQALGQLQKAQEEKNRALSEQSNSIQESLPENQLSIVMFSGELDKLLAAFVIATGAAASGMKVRIFFTFWATAALTQKAQAKKDIWSRMVSWFLPKGMGKARLSQMNFAGAGTLAMKFLMKKKGVASVEELLGLAADLDVGIDVCTMSMDLLGIRREEIIDYPHLNYCGVTSFVDVASSSRTSLFI